MPAIPYNTARGAASSLQMSPPFAFSDVTMSVFPLRASLSRLEAFCNNYLNQAPHLVQFKPFIPFVYLVILDYGRMSLQAANMGWVSQREVAFGVPLRWLNATEDGLQFQDWAFTSPFIFVDNEMSMSTGREVYGWPKLLAKLDPSVSEWVRDPHGARRVFQVSTKRAAHAYSGEVQEYRPFLSVYQHRAAGLFDIPPSMETITKPLEQLSTTAMGLTRLSGDLLRTFTGMASDGITGSPVLPNFLDMDTFREQLSPERLKSWTSPKDWVPGIRDTLWSLFPRSYANTINFKQFRDAGDPHATCYQAITSARMPVKSIAQGGLLGPQNMLLGQLDGGYRIDIHNLAGLPIVESLGLEVAQERESDGTLVSSLTPVCPLWMQVDMTYGLADTLVWRNRKDDWNRGEFLNSLIAEKQKPADTSADIDPEAAVASQEDDQARPKRKRRYLEPLPKQQQQTPQDHDDDDDAFDLDYIRTMNFFNTARGASEAIGGAFTMPNASIRVLPLKADSSALQKFVSNYLRVEDRLRFDAWGDFVYLVICDFDQMNSKLNAIAKRRAREVNLMVPVKCYTWFDDKESEDEDIGDRARRGGDHMVTTGFVSAFSYVDDAGTAITASEVAGIPTMGSRINAAENDWLNLNLSQDRAKRDILDLRAHVLPALMSGAQGQERSVIQLHSHTPPHTKVHESQHESVNNWVGLLADDLRHKSQEKRDAGTGSRGDFPIGQGFALQLLGGDLPINQFSLKQFRDSRFTLSACYQGLVQRRHRIQKLSDMRELEEPLHVSITDFPTQPITEILGLIPKFSYPGKDRVVRVFEALRPFSITADLVREAGNTLFERVGSEKWQRVDDIEQIFGWRKSTTGDARTLIDKADLVGKDCPVEVRYTCKMPDQPEPFRIHTGTVSPTFLKKRFKRHLDTGTVTDLAIRDRHLLGKVRVTTDRKLLNIITAGDALDIAAFNAQVRMAGKDRAYGMAEAAYALELVSPATIADSILSLQWGLAPGSKRRHHDKPAFCVPAETVPNQFTERLFPRTERLHGYWPLTEKFFANENRRRAAEVLGFRSELRTLVEMIGASVGMKFLYGQKIDKPDDGVNSMINTINKVLTESERIVFKREANAIKKTPDSAAEKQVNLFIAFADAVLPPTFSVGAGFRDRGLTISAHQQQKLVSTHDWKRVESALPRLFEVAKSCFGQDADYQEGAETMMQTFLERVVENHKEMKLMESAHQEDNLEEFYLHVPDELLSRRLSELVTRGALLKK